MLDTIQNLIENLLQNKTSTADQTIRANVDNFVDTFTEIYASLTALSSPQQIVTFTNLPMANSVNNGTRYFVSDALSFTFGATIVRGGGSFLCPVYSDGVDWRMG